MKASAVKDAIVATIEGLTPSDTSGPRDRFRYSSELTTTSANRTFAVRDYLWPSRYDSLPHHNVIQFLVSVLYTHGSAAMDRRVDDSIQISDALIAIPAASTRAGRTYPQVVLVEVLPQPVGTPETGSDLLIANCIAQVRFDPRTL